MTKKQDEKLMNESVNSASTAKDVAVIDQSLMREMVNIGMSQVDPNDIRPPQIILVQKTSNLDLLQDKNGKTPKEGQFFHTGKREIYDSFDCNFVFASKSKFINKLHENEEQDQYKSLGVLPDGSLFAMTFRSSALWALSPLFSAVKSQEVPMFALNAKVETKILTNNKGQSWSVPVIRVGQIISEPERFDRLYNLAKSIDAQSEAIAKKLKEEEGDE